MDSHDNPTPAVIEYAPADPNIVPAVDAPLIDPDVSVDVFGIIPHTEDAEAATTGNVEFSSGSGSAAERKPWYRTPSVWWYVVFDHDVV
jgi:hypothetical protein